MAPHLPPRCHGPVNSQFSQVILKPVLPVLQLQFAIKKSPFICPPVRARYQDAPFRYMSAGLLPVPDCTIKVSRRHLLYALYYEKRSFLVHFSFLFYSCFRLSFISEIHGRHTAGASANSRPVIGSPLYVLFAERLYYSFPHFMRNASLHQIGKSVIEQIHCFAQRKGCFCRKKPY